MNDEEAGVINEISTQTEIRDWIAAHEFERLQLKLNSGTDEFRFRILTELLVNAMRDFEVPNYKGHPIL